MSGDIARSGCRQAWAIAFGAFCILTALRIALVLRIAPETPYYDEWDGVIAAIARPLLAGVYDARTLFAPHNEHVLFWTRALSWLQLRAANDQFDNVAVCLASQVLYGVIASVLIAAGASNIPRWRSAYVAAALIATGVPYAWENIGMGWGNPYYFLIVFSAAGIIAAATWRMHAAALPLLAALAAAAGVAMGSGFFVVPAAGLALVLRVRIGTLSRGAALRAGAALVAAALATIPLLPQVHVSFSWSVVQCAQFGLLVVLCAPALVVLRRLASGRGTNADVAFACIVVWGMAQVTAILVARPVFRLWHPISRYVDVLTLAAFANLGCLCRLAAADSRRHAAAVGRIALSACIAAGLLGAPVAWHWMELRADAQREQAARLARYIQAGDASALDSAPDALIAYPDRARLRELADAADVRVILGDRAGSRSQPAAFVARRRAITGALADNGGWLLPLAIGLGLLALYVALRPRVAVNR